MGQRELNPWESLVQEVLEDLQKEGDIAGYRWSAPSDPLDREGIDFLIYLNNGLAAPIQVKSARGNLHYKTQKHLKKHPLIKKMLFVLLPKEAEEKQEILKCIRKDLKRLL